MELVQTSHTIIAKEKKFMKKLILVIVLGFSANAFAISDECERILILQAQFEILAKDSAEQLNMDQAVVTDVQARNEDFVVSIPVLYTKGSYTYRVSYTAKGGNCNKLTFDGLRTEALHYEDGSLTSY